MAASSAAPRIAPARVPTWIVCVAVALAYGAGWMTARRDRVDAGRTTDDQQPAPAEVRGAAGAGHASTAANVAGMGSALPAEARWQRATAAPRTPANEREMAEALAQLATRDPDRARALALAEPNSRLREILRNAVLRGWGTLAPDEAIAWVMKLPDADTRSAVEAVLMGAAQQPAEVVRLGRKLCAENPDLATDYGQFVLSALADVGAFDVAAKFALDDTTSNRGVWLNSAFNQWGLHQPQTALAAMNAIADATARTEALQGLVAGWGEADPKSLAEYALRLPSGEDRTVAFAQALPRWISRDPIAASQWLKSFDPDPSLDSGVMAIATMPNLISQRPEVSVEWAEGIADAAMRASALQMIGEQWSFKSPAAFRRYLESNSRLRPEDRKSLTEGANRLIPGADVGG